MGESGRGFDSEFMRKSPNFLYTKSMLLLVIRTTQTLSFTFYKEFFFGLFHSK